MANNSLEINQGTNSAINFDSNGGTFTQVIGIGYGTVSTIGTLPNLPGGTLNSVTVTGGTVSVNELSGTVNLGTITGNVGLSSGTLNAGTINTGTINSATVSGGTINLATVSGNLGTIGTIGLATISGNVGMSSGTLNVATISTLPNIPGGSIVVTTGTQNAGTVNTGTINTGTINTGTINLGTFVGKDANAAAQTGNPVSIGGTDSGGTVRTVLINSAGAMSVSGASSGTFNNISTGTMQTLGTVGTIQNILAGTISGLQNGTISAGTINTGTINAGTINAGTLGTISNVGQLYNAGTVQNQLAGTLTALQNGTVYKGIAAGQSGSLTAAGTIISSGSQLDISCLTIEGTWVGTVFFEAQVGTSTWFAMNAFSNVGASGGVGTQTTVNGDYMQSMAGLDGVRARVTYSSGTLTYNQRASNFFSPLVRAQTNADQANAAAIVNRGLVMAGYDGANGRFIATDNTGKLQVIQTAGTMGVGTITAGSIIVTAGTVSVGTVNTGTVNAGTINTGTINAGTINNGSIVVTAGTVSAGTINAGTFQQNPVPTIAQSTYGTHGTTGVSIFGTLAGGTGSGAGTELFITSLSLSIPSTGGSQDCSIGFGTNGGTFQAGTGLLVRGNFPPGGGIQKQFSPPINSGTNGQICLFQAGAGTVDANITYFTTPSTL